MQFYLVTKNGLFHSRRCDFPGASHVKWKSPFGVSGSQYVLYSQTDGCLYVSSACERMFPLAQSCACHHFRPKRQQISDEREVWESNRGWDRHVTSVRFNWELIRKTNTLSPISRHMTWSSVVIGRSWKIRSFCISQKWQMWL